MRNRPLKTTLTAITIVLLTFTILVFSSFTSKLGVVETYMGKGQGVDRIEVHRPSFLDIPENLENAITTGYSAKYNIYKRKAGFQNPLLKKLGMSPQPYIITNLDTEKAVVLDGVIGLQKEEIKARGDFADSFSGLLQYKGDDQYEPVMISKVAADQLQIKKGGIITLFGHSYRVIEFFNDARFQSLGNVDETRIIPPNYNATLQENDIDNKVDKTVLEESLDTIDTSSFIWSSSELSAVFLYESLEKLNISSNYISLYPKSSACDLADDATSLARIFRGKVFVQSSDGAMSYFFTKALEGAGMGDIVVPLLLGGLIIFSSLLGSIVDREKEIFTYSALGLSPPDVAALFFAESSVYAVIGGMGGYLMSQLVAKLLGLLSHWGIFQAPEMNFSSLSSIYTILLVMLVVILSTIYPALKAGKSANPGVARKWKMPEVDGNKVDFIFPFTVSESDLAGVLSFISEHFENHSDASLGNFAAKEVQIFSEKDQQTGEASLGIKAMLSLAPFDLGVFQYFSLSSKDSDIEGIKEVVINLERVSGPPAAWIRSNRQFIDELRNQFLLWRSLPVETVEYYRSMTESALDNTIEG